MNLTDWLQQVEQTLPELQRIARQCDPEFRAKCFEVLLLSTLADLRGEQFVSPGPEPGARPRSRVPDDVHKEFSGFLSNHGLSIGDLSRVIDLGSGAILVRDAGKNKAEGQRILACLIALRHLKAEGALRIPKEELVESCKDWGIYDSGTLQRI